MNEFDVDAAVVKAFDRAYIASQPPAVREIFKGDQDDHNPDGSPAVRLEPGDRYALALKLAPDYDIDWWIMALGGDPYFTMLERKMGGVQVVSYLRNHALKISTNPADFPPFPDPIVTPPAQSAEMVGGLAYGNIYFATQRAINMAKAGALAHGTMLSENGATYQFQISIGLMGASYTWVKQ